MEDAIFGVTWEGPHFGTAVKELVERVTAWEPKYVVPPVTNVPGVEVVVIPPGVRYLRYWAHSPNATFQCRLDVHVAK